MKFEFTEEQVKILGATLRKMPWEVSNDLIVWLDKIIQPQADKQLSDKESKKQEVLS